MEFDPNQIAPGDILSEKRITNIDGTMTERARWLVLERHLCQPEMEDIGFNGQPVFKCLLVSFNPNYRPVGWEIGIEKWVKPGSTSLWDVVVESGLSWGDD